jgi:hypothetical protein
MKGLVQNFDLPWNYVVGGVSFCQFVISRTGSEEYASIEINLIGIAGVRLLRLFSEKPKNCSGFQTNGQSKPLSLNYPADAGEFHIMRQ